MISNPDALHLKQPFSALAVPELAFRLGLHRYLLPAKLLRAPFSVCTHSHVLGLASVTHRTVPFLIPELPIHAASAL
jgi:hypothetical protein